VTARTLAVAVTGTAAALVAGYAAAGPAGLIDAASVAAVAVLVVARGTVRGEKPRPVRLKNPWHKGPAVSAAEFPAYRKIFSDLSWAQVSWRHYEHPLRPMLARLAAALNREPAGLPETGDPDGPGPDLAALGRIIAGLEGPVS
jgi:hypothetical protein